MSIRQFVRNSILLISAELMAKILGVVFFVLIARSLGAGDLGRYSFAVALANFFVIAPKFGFDELVQREISRHNSKAYRFFTEISVIKLTLSLASLIILALINLGRPDFTPVIMAGCFVFTYSFMEFVDSFFRALQRSELELAVRGVFSVGNLVLGVSVLYLGWGLIGVMSSQLLAAVIALTCAILILRRFLEKTTISRTWISYKSYAAAAAPFAGMLVALYLSNQVCTLTLTYFADKTNVGYFAAAMRIMDCLVLIPAAIMGSFLPTMSKFYPRSVTSFVQTLRLIFKYLFVLSAPLLVVLVVLAKPIILLLYGKNFSPAADSLMVMGLVLPFSFWNYAATTSLLARNQEKSAMGFLWALAAIHVTANLIFIPRYSHVGACWAIFTTQGAYFLILFSNIRRYINLAGLLRTVFAPALSACIMGIFLYTVKDYNVFVTSSAGVVVYLGVLLLSGSINRTEIDYFRSWRFA